MCLFVSVCILLFVYLFVYLFSGFWFPNMLLATVMLSANLRTRRFTKPTCLLPHRQPQNLSKHSISRKIFLPATSLTAFLADSFFFDYFSLTPQLRFSITRKFQNFECVLSCVSFCIIFSYIFPTCQMRARFSKSLSPPLLILPAPDLRKHWTSTATRECHGGDRSKYCETL